MLFISLIKKGLFRKPGLKEQSGKIYREDKFTLYHELYRLKKSEDNLESRLNRI